jgi:hypothetical protein
VPYQIRSGSVYGMVQESEQVELLCLGCSWEQNVVCWEVASPSHMKFVLPTVPIGGAGTKRPQVAASLRFVAQALIRRLMP